ncbi:hypothetical protein D9M72_519950 [compost metagenome]
MASSGAIAWIGGRLARAISSSSAATCGSSGLDGRPGVAGASGLEDGTADIGNDADPDPAPAARRSSGASPASGEVRIVNDRSILV